MADEEEKRKKLRTRIERDVYSVLLSFKDGATPQQLEKRMDDTLGYTYVSKYAAAGVRDMGQLLRECSTIRQTGDGKFKIIVTEEVSDLAALVSAQKEGKRKKGGKGKRPATSAGYRNGFGGGITLRSSPKGMAAFRPKSHFQPQGHYRPTTAAAHYKPSGFGVYGGSLNQSFGGHQNRPQFRAPSAAAAYVPTTQKPLSRPVPPPSSLSNSTTQTSSSSSRRVSAPSPAPSIDRASHTETVKPATKTCQMPSIKEFCDNSKQMMIKMYPRTFHLSEMTEFYNQEYGVFVDPLQVFSKSWKMLILSTFKDWLENVDGQVGLKKEWAQKNVKKQFATDKPTLGRTMSAIGHSLVQVDPPVPPTQPASVPPESLPQLQGFRYQTPKSPTDIVVQKMKGLTVGNRRALATPEKPPGLVRQTNGFSFNPFSNVQRPKTAMIPDPSVYGGMRPLTANAVRHQNSVLPSNTATSNSSDSSTLHNSPSSSSETVPSQPASVSPPLAPPVRMRSVQSSKPTSRLIGQALAAVKKQGDEAPVPRRIDTPTKPLYVSATTTPIPKNKPLKVQAAPKTTVTATVADEWDEPAVAIKPQEGRAMSIIGHSRPSLLPPMSKGSTRSFPSSRKSACSSRASSRGRVSQMVTQAIDCGLPDSDGWD